MKQRQNNTYLAGLITISIYLIFSHACRANDITEIQLNNNEPVLPLPASHNLDINKVKLGRKIFFDPRLSRGNVLACVSCHDLAGNGAETLSISKGRNNFQLSVNTPSIFNSALNPWLFWDGRASSLEQQIDFVVHNHLEFDTTWPTLVAQLKKDEFYQSKFSDLYTDGISTKNIRDIIATFVRSLVTPNSRFDRYLLGDSTALSADEKRGYQLFKEYGCTSCHQGRNLGGNLFQQFGIFNEYFKNKNKINKADLGRFNVTGREQDKHVFRVPSLRNVAVTAPYLHDGSIPRLDETIRVIAKYQLGLTIPDMDIELITVFLKTLTGEYEGRSLNINSSPGATQ